MNDLTRTILRGWLFENISDISEAVYAAGWHSGIEYEVWSECQGVRALPEDLKNPGLFKMILDVARELDEWCFEGKPIGMEEWKNKVAARG